MEGESEQKARKRIQGLFLELYTPESDDAAFVDFFHDKMIVNNKYLRVYVNLTKSRNQIEGELKKILDEYLSDKTKSFYGIEGKKPTPRINEKVWKSCFQVYDMVQYEGLSYPDIAIKLKMKINTVHKQYKKTWKNIYPEKEYPTKRYRETEIPFPCFECKNRVCETTMKTCEECEKYLRQYDTPRGGHPPGDFDELADHQVFQDWKKAN